MSLANDLPWLALALAVAVVAIQSLIVQRYVALLHAAQPGRLAKGRPLPKAAVVLSVRGADPRLETVLQSLLDQRYPDYCVSVIVDSRVDPAWPIVMAAADTSRPGMVIVDLLRQRADSCSLKCAALAQAVESLPEDIAVVAFLDGDTVPHASWLADLVTALEDPVVGVATGNRWYTPHARDMGAIVRHYWNAGAVVQVWFNGIPWAGSMAIRRETLRSAGIVESWRRSLSVDGTVGRRLKAEGLAVRFVPEALMSNDEHISRDAFAEWLVRQLVAARSTQAGWGVVLMHAGIMLAIQLSALVAVGIAAGHGNIAGAAVAAGALTSYWAGCLAAAAAIDHAARSVTHRQGGAPPEPPRISWRGLAAAIDAHVIYFLALARATACKKVRWRGIEYEILGAERVRMVNYVTFAPTITQSNASIV